MATITRTIVPHVIRTTSRYTFISSRLTRLLHLDSGNMDRVTNRSSSCCGDLYTLTSSSFEADISSPSSTVANNLNQCQRNINKDFLTLYSLWNIYHSFRQVGNYLELSQFVTPGSIFD